MEPTPDRMTILTIRVVLGLTVWLVLSNTAFQALGIPYKDPWVFVTMCTGMIGAIVYTTYDKRKHNKYLKPLNILLVEDSPMYTAIIKTWMRNNAPENQITIAKNPETALMILRREDTYKYAQKPDLILLDLGFPAGSMQGSEFAAALRKDPNLDDVEIIIITGHDRKEFSGDTSLGGAPMPFCSAWIEKGQGMPALLQAINDVKTKLIDKGK